MSSSGEMDALMAQAAETLAAGDYAGYSAVARKTPLHDRMGLEVLQVSRDATVATMELTEEVRGVAPGTVHGGILATFADVVSAIALAGAYDVTTDITVTTDLHVRYYRQPLAGPLTATATVVHAGRRLLSTECSIVDAQDRVLARSTATYMVVPRLG